MPPREAPRGFREDGQHVPDLLRPRSREESHHSPPTRRTPPRGRATSGAAFGSASLVEERVSDELRAHTVPLEQRRFEREDGEDAVAVAPQLAGPALPPGPHLRRDVVEDPPPLPPGAPGQPQVQPRVVDRKKQPHILPHEETPDPALQSEEARQAPQNLHPPHDRQLIQPGEPRHSGRVHLAAANAEQPRVGQPPANLPRDRRAVVVSRRLAGGDEDRRPRSRFRGQDTRPR